MSQSDDTISRQDAIDVIMGEPTDAHYPSWYADKIKALPSAEPKTGKWVEVEKDEYEGFSIVNMRCNQCWRYSYLVLPKGTKCVYDYCPWCKADMRGEEEYELAIEQMEHDAMYEPTYNSEDGSM